MKQNKPIEKMVKMMMPRRIKNSVKVIVVIQVELLH